MNAQTLAALLKSEESDNCTCIYALCCPRTGDVRYIGKANDPVRRLRLHCTAARNEQTHKGRWIKSLHAAGLRPDLAIVARVSLGNWQEWERRAIEIARAGGAQLTNSTSGGEGFSDLSPDSRERQRASTTIANRRNAAHPNHNNTPEWRDAHANAMRALRGDPRLRQGPRDRDAHRAAVRRSWAARRAAPMEQSTLWPD